jgi:hypothetical protein
LFKAAAKFLRAWVANSLVMLAPATSKLSVPGHMHTAKRA